MSIKNVYVRNALKQKHIIQYVRDKFGYVKGVAVAFGKDKIGWAMVAPSDHTWKKEKLHNIPSVGHLLRKGITWDELIPTPLVQNILDRGLVMNIPLFDKETGLNKAIHRALASRTKVEESPIQEIGAPIQYVASGDLIRDDDLDVALERLAVRVAKASKYFGGE